MSQGSYPYLEALEAAQCFVANIQHVCVRVQIAGSLRRQQSYYQAGGRTAEPRARDVGDIEVVAVAELEGGENLLLARVERAYKLWTGTDKNGQLYQRSGPKHRKLVVPVPGPALRAPDLIPLDLYLTTEDTWGYTLALRTGPAGDGRTRYQSWNAMWARHRSKGGLLPEHITLKEGVVYNQGQPVPVATEEMFFLTLGLPWVAPHKRSAEAAGALRVKLERRGEATVKMVAA